MKTEEGWVQNGPCVKCGSSDACAVYDDGHTHCFSCGDHQGNRGFRRSEDQEEWTLEYTDLRKRGIREDTCRKFRYGLRDGLHHATYFNRVGQPVAFKIRRPDKVFTWRGPSKDAVLFGQQLWKEGGKRVVITEGEIDALSVSQAMGNRWPVVSLKNGAGGAVRDVKAQLEWLDSYETVVLMFDSDEPGREAAVRVAELFPPGKARIAQLPLKDPNELLVAGRMDELISAFWEAKAFRPEGLLTGAEALEKVLEVDDAEYLTYPWAGLNRLTRGARSSAIMTICGGSGLGKSQICREIAHWVIRNGHGLGYIALEESVRTAAQGILSVFMERPLHLLEGTTPPEDIRAAAEKLGFNRENVVFFDHFGSLANETLVSKIRFMSVSLGIRWIILDHVSIVVSGQRNDNERQAIDWLMTELRSLCQETGVGLFLVSHLKRPPGEQKQWEEGRRPRMADLRGSAGIEQLSNYIFGLWRNMRADGPERNELHVDVLKNRHTGETGHACVLRYSLDRCRLTEVVETAVSEEGDDF